MTIKEILSITKHRPWKMPSENWKFYQEWNNVIFLHFKVDLNELKKFVPEELEIDLFEGKPWVSVVAFTMERIRTKNLPSFSPISDFDEINIRTYVKSNTKTGVYFLSIEGGKLLSCKIAKAVSQLPYRYSKIKRTLNNYSSSNALCNDSLSIEYVIGKEVEQKSELEIWLTERYALFQDAKKTINKFEIHHVAWSINEIDFFKYKLNYKRFDTLFEKEPEIIQYSKGVKVIAWGKCKI
tara:strand:+ start:5848 stop:6564 length:717 start_codon:yes stop_codon:yes gene_type:complete